MERIVYLNLSTVNTKKFVQSVEDALNEGGVEAAKDLCRNTRGPIASIYYQLDRSGEGIEMVEKSVVSMESSNGTFRKRINLVAIIYCSCTNAGFLGTVIGMIQAFDKIGRWSGLPTVADGIKYLF